MTFDPYYIYDDDFSLDETVYEDTSNILDSDFSFEQISFEEESGELEEKKSSKKKKIQVNIAIDSEFKHDSSISLQVAAKFFWEGKEYTFTFIVFNKCYKLFLSDKLVSIPPHVRVYYDDFQTDHVGMTYFFQLLFEEFSSSKIFDCSFHFLLYFYYSPKDLILFFGLDFYILFLLKILLILVIIYCKEDL